MKEQVKVLINSKKEYKQHKSILKGLGERVWNQKYDSGYIAYYFRPDDNEWCMARSINDSQWRTISIRDLIILLTKPEEEKVFVMTSEDGVKLYDGDRHYPICNTKQGWKFSGFSFFLRQDGAFINEQSLSGSIFSNEPEEYKAFSTKESAEKWILEQNKPHQIEIKHNDSETSTVMKDKVFIECFDKGKLVQVVHLSKAAIEQITEAFNKINNQ